LIVCATSSALRPAAAASACVASIDSTAFCTATADGSGGVKFTVIPVFVTNCTAGSRTSSAHSYDISPLVFYDKAGALQHTATTASTASVCSTPTTTASCNHNINK